MGLGLWQPDGDESQDLSHGFGAAYAGIVRGNPKVEQFEVIGGKADHDGRAIRARTTPAGFFNIAYCVAHSLTILEKTSRRKD